MELRAFDLFGDESPKGVSNLSGFLEELTNPWCLGSQLFIHAATEGLRFGASSEICFLVPVNVLLILWQDNDKTNCVVPGFQTIEVHKSSLSFVLKPHSPNGNTFKPY